MTAPADTSTPRPGNCCRRGIRLSTPSARRMTPCTWQVRPEVRRQGRARRNQRRQTLHRLSHQLPHQATRPLLPSRHRSPSRPRRPAARRAPLRAVLTDLRELAPLRHHPQEPTARPDPRPVQRQGTPAPTTSATPDAAFSPPASGPARPWTTTAPTAKPGSRPCSIFRQLTPAGSAGNASHRATRTPCRPRGSSCTFSMSASDGATP